MFAGAFNKKNGFCERQWVSEKYDLEYVLDAQLFGKVAALITQILGDKTKYTVQDAYRYFYLSYHAYQIDYRQFYNYCHTDAARCFDISEPTIGDDADLELLAEESGRFFSYLTDGKFTAEQALTLVIDRHILRESVGMTAEDNLILVIGSFDGAEINSMKVLLNPNIPEIEYALEFFRLHS